MALDMLRQSFIHNFCEQALGSTTSETNVGETSHNLHRQLTRLGYLRGFMRLVFCPNVQDGKSLVFEKAAKMQTKGILRN